LDQAAPGAGERSRRGDQTSASRRRDDGPDEDLDVPEFMPRD
jgi:hypothetical protein